MNVYDRLYYRYGPRGWWPSESAFETMLGAILTQNTTWRNAAKALVNLRNSGVMNPEDLRKISVPHLESIIRPSGYYRTKARKLKALASYMFTYRDDVATWSCRNPEDLRRELLSVYGIGPETADVIVLYVAKLPSFVIDSFTKRILGRLGITLLDERYESYQEFFASNLIADESLFNEYHALLDYHGQTICKKRAPACACCCLFDMCEMGQQGMADFT